jgi:hypothetical protein
VRHGLEGSVSVRHAALVESPIGGHETPWYDLSALDDIVGPIDLLIVDGPPQSVGALARYPAVPSLIDRLAAGALVILDDAQRDAEAEAVERWIAEFPGQFVRLPVRAQRLAVLQRIAG